LKIGKIIVLALLIGVLMPKILTNSKLPHVIDFTEKMGESALNIERQTGANAIFILAKTALETGHGRSVIWLTKEKVDETKKIYWTNKNATQPKPPQTLETYSYNLFNIAYNPKRGGKWAWGWVSQHDPKTGTWYFHWEKMCLYDSFEDSLQDWLRLISNSDRYAEAWKVRHDLVQFANMIQKAGFATDPNYAKSIISVSKMYYIVEDKIEKTSNVTIKTNKGIEI
jgi:peptidoglycan hydrolase FlgJ